jgi:hypothetical protein
MCPLAPEMASYPMLTERLDQAVNIIYRDPIILYEKDMFKPYWFHKHFITQRFQHPAPVISSKPVTGHKNLHVAK